ncbi:MAG: RraA family protein [Breznakia sp.]
MFKNESEMFEMMKKQLYTPVVGDILDELGYFHQFLPQSIQAIDHKMKLAGKACTILMMDVFEKQDKPFGYLTEALDQLAENEIYVATGGTQRCAYWGEILTATAKKRGAKGAVLNGWHRDTPQVLEQEWPVFSRGCWAQDSSVRTKVIDYRCRIEIGSVVIQDGDLIFGDVDGIVVIPKEVAIEVIEKAFEKASKEKLVRKEIENGLSSTKAFEKYGIL